MFHTHINQHLKLQLYIFKQHGNVKDFGKKVWSLVHVAYSSGAYGHQYMEFSGCKYTAVDRQEPKKSHLLGRSSNKY